MAAQRLPDNLLMQRAGLAIAKLAMAIAPHAKSIWIPCGPGNNGGDGYEAAAHLKSWGKSPVVTCLQGAKAPSADSAVARKRAADAGVLFADAPPQAYELCIDALFGIGRLRALDSRCMAWMLRINSGYAPVLAVDVPSGLDADTGTTPPVCVKADFTLSLLTLKPGLFTADGRDASGEIWFNDLQVKPTEYPYARLNCRPTISMRAHNTHKGSYGDVCVVGGQAGMSGAALLAARAALRGGAGRVYASLIDAAATGLDATHPELMLRDYSALKLPLMAVVAGCGGGHAMQDHMPRLLEQSGSLVLDADALNALAKDDALQALLVARPANSTVLTPHPLEAARLMGTSTARVQADRLGIAMAMAERFACTVVLKGSGTVIAAPGQVPRINPTGNARLATAGTGDVLAGLMGARLAAGAGAFLGACEAVFRHGQVADGWCSRYTMTAQDLADAV